MAKRRNVVLIAPLFNGIGTSIEMKDHVVGERFANQVSLEGIELLQELGLLLSKIHGGYPTVTISDHYYFSDAIRKIRRAGMPRAVLKE